MIVAWFGVTRIGDKIRLMGCSGRLPQFGLFLVLVVVLVIEKIEFVKPVAKRIEDEIENEDDIPGDESLQHNTIIFLQHVVRK
jgi:hypothetical protein